MADPVTQEEREKYTRVWEHDSYRERSPAMRVLEEGLSWLNPAPGASFADFGCGTGRAAQALFERGHRVTAVDIAANACREYFGPFVEACLWELPDMGQVDHAICCDVLEHIPPKQIWAVLRGIRDRVKHTAFFQIARFEDADGLHLCLRDPDWWSTSFNRHFSRVEWQISEKYLLARAFTC
jgi:2-polyprenyl-3-methyl-5-hydroxy-6-metoxy-1,4-benzoquinol methylase